MLLISTNEITMSSAISSASTSPMRRILSFTVCMMSLRYASSITRTSAVSFFSISRRFSAFAYSDFSVTPIEA